MKRRDLLTTSALTLVTTTATAARADVIPFFPAKRPPDIELRNLLDTQARQWSRGDIEAFCANYDEACIFVSPSGLTRGRTAVLDRYKEKYGAAKESMGTLSFEVLGITADDEVASIALRWKLVWDEKMKKPSAEGFSVIGLLKRGERWLVTHDASM